MCARGKVPLSLCAPRSLPSQYKQERAARTRWGRVCCLAALSETKLSTETWSRCCNLLGGQLLGGQLRRGAMEMTTPRGTPCEFVRQPPPSLGTEPLQVTPITARCQASTVTGLPTYPTANVTHSYASMLNSECRWRSRTGCVDCGCAVASSEAVAVAVAGVPTQERTQAGGYYLLCSVF